MAIKLKEGKTIKDPYDGYISTAIGKANALIYRDEKKATIIVKIWKDEATMDSGAKPIITDSWDVSGDWYETYFNTSNTYTDVPALLTAHCAYLVVHDYYDVRILQDDTVENVYRYSDWEEYIT